MLTVKLLGRARRAAFLTLLAAALLGALSGSALADRLHLADGSVFEVDEAWEDARGVWYKRGGVTQWIARERVRSVERAAAGGSGQVKQEAKTPAPAW